MQRKRHPSATTTEAIRRRIQNSRESTRKLAARLGVNRKTVQKWRKRDDVKDGWRGRSKERSSTVLSKDEEAIAIGLRKQMRLPLDDCLYALRDMIPTLKRSSLYRCFKRYGVSRLPAAAAMRTQLERSGERSLGEIRIDIGETTTGEGDCRVFAAVDRGSLLFYARPYGKADAQTACRFLEELIDVLPYRIRAIITVNDEPFAATAKRGSAAARARAGKFARLCARNGIELRLTEPDQVWATIQLERMARLTAHESHRHMDDYILGFVAGYNFGSRLKILGGITPYQFVCRVWKRNPQLFRRSPLHLHLATRPEAAKQIATGWPKF